MLSCLQLDDVLWFATDIDGVRYLLKDPRLEAVQARDATKLRGRQIYRHLVQVRGTSTHCENCFVMKKRLALDAILRHPLQPSNATFSQSNIA